MSITHERLELALKSLKGSDWERFERLCSQFLVSDWPGARTMASPSGDGGRDAQLFRMDGYANAMFQFSVQADWDVKIRHTIRRLKSEFPDTTILMFMSNQDIGAKGDSVRQFARTQGIFLDILDRSWFIERQNSDSSRTAAAEELAAAIVDPLLRESRILANAPALDGQDAKTALVFLEMQARDESAAKGLTKSCFEALVKASLHGTSAEARRSRQQIHDRVHELLPQHSPEQLSPFIDAALRRMSKSQIKHHAKEDEFHIAHEEALRIRDSAAAMQLLNDAFDDDVRDIVVTPANLPAERVARVAAVVRKTVETYFYRLGEEFAQSLAQDRPLPLHADALKNAVVACTPAEQLVRDRDNVEFVLSVTRSLLANPSEATTELFRLLSTSYTLFAFLAEVPDVQKATKKLFEHGSIWLDTSVLLPVFAERAFPETMRPFTDLFGQIRRAGIRLFVTDGVIEEIDAHLSRCEHYLRVQTWEGRVPYVYARFSLAGRRQSEFATWLENFRGRHRPTDDIADFISEAIGAERMLQVSTEGLPREVISEVERYWQSVQDERRGQEGFSMQAHRLAAHDSETYLAVLSRRRLEPGKGALGYTSWLFTMDSAAWHLLSNIDGEVAGMIQHSPVISLDFLMKYLAFGPRRDLVDQSIKGHDRIFTATVFDSVPPELIETAQQVRRGCEGLPERIIQRRIRDALDQQRMSAGALQKGGLEQFDATRDAGF